MIIFKKFFNKQNIEFNSMNLFLGIISNLKLLKLRLSRSAVKFSTINLKKFQIILKKKDPKKNCILNANSFSAKKDLINASSKVLRQYGVLVVENCFSKDEVNNFLKLNEEIDPRLNTSKEDINTNYMVKNKKQIPLKKNIFLLDSRIIDTIEMAYSEKKINENIYIRRPSFFTYFNATEKNTKDNWTSGWHIDFPTQITTHIILEDLSKESTRMQVLPMTKELLLIPGKHYKINYHFNDFEKYFLDCVGPKGTLYIHTGNTLHRNFPVYNTNRFLWSQTYTIDKIFESITSKDKSEILNNSQDFYNSLNQSQIEKIKIMLELPDFLEKGNHNYFKLVNGKYISATKKDLTYV